MTDKLLPCPFCGGESRVGQDTSSDYERHWRWFAECLNYDNCGVELIGFSTREQAVTAWNRRTSLYSHRNGETEAPTAPGRYWFRGEINGCQHEFMTTVNYGCGMAWNDIDWVNAFVSIKQFVGQWWGPVLAPWEGENVNQ